MRQPINKQNQCFGDEIVKFIYTLSASNAYLSLTNLDWVELTLDLTVVQPMVELTANDIRQIGVQFDSGDPYQGGSFVGPLDTVSRIDAITAQ